MRWSNSSALPLSRADDSKSQSLQYFHFFPLARTNRLEWPCLSLVRGKVQTRPMQTMRKMIEIVSRSEDGTSLSLALFAPGGFLLPIKSQHALRSLSSFGPSTQSLSHDIILFATQVLPFAQSAMLSPVRVVPLLLLSHSSIHGHVFEPRATPVDPGEKALVQNTLPVITKAPGFGKVKAASSVTQYPNTCGFVDGNFSE